MTVCEQKTMNAIISISHKMKDSRKIDWEQRRYEIAKEILPKSVEYACELLERGELFPDKYGDMFLSEVAADVSVAYADALIRKLRGETADHNERNLNEDA